MITAFAPVSAGDPYGTDTNCDTSLSARTAAKGILTDRETGLQIIEDDACAASSYGDESPWESSTKNAKPAVKQFHNRRDGIVDVSCMEKVTDMLKKAGYPTQEPFVIRGGWRKKLANHLWLDEYNEPLLDFFSAQEK